MLRWYTDGIAKRFYEELKYVLQPWTDVQLPKHELTHVGVRDRNPLQEAESQEIVITLHFNPKGTVRYKDNLNEYTPEQTRLLK